MRHFWIFENFEFNFWVKSWNCIYRSPSLFRRVFKKIVKFCRKWYDVIWDVFKSSDAYRKYIKTFGLKLLNAALKNDIVSKQIFFKFLNFQHFHIKLWLWSGIGFFQNLTRSGRVDFFSEIFQVGSGRTPTRVLFRQVEKNFRPRSGRRSGEFCSREV